VATLTRKQQFDKIRGLTAAPPKGVTRTPTTPSTSAPKTTAPTKHRKRVRLNAPIVPGSTTTERQLAAAANAAANVEFGGQLGEANQAVNAAKNYQTDFTGPGGFYDQYLAKLQEHNQNVAAIGNVASAAMTGLQAGITGLGQQTQQQVQGQANAQAAQTGMGPAGDLTSLGSNALAVRQALVGAFIGNQAARNAAAQTFSDTLANVVGPGEKLQGVAQGQAKIEKARADRKTLKGQIGSFKTEYGTKARQDESDRVIAAATLEGKTAAEYAKSQETIRHNKATETNERDRIAASQKTADDAAARDASKTNKWGVENGKWASWSDKQRLKWIKRYHAANTTPGKDGKDGKDGGPEFQTPGQQSAGITQTGILKDFVKLAKEGNPFDPKHRTKDWKKRPLSRDQATTKVRQYFGEKLKNPFLLRAAVDSLYDGHLSAYTVKHLIAAGYRPREVAAALGVPTHDDWLKTPAGKAWLRTQKNTQSYSGQSNLGGTGHM
jgi:hypothetical protein